MAAVDNTNPNKAQIEVGIDNYTLSVLIQGSILKTYVNYEERARWIAHLLGPHMRECGLTLGVRPDCTCNIYLLDNVKYYEQLIKQVARYNAMNTFLKKVYHYARNNRNFQRDIDELFAHWSYGAFGDRDVQNVPGIPSPSSDKVYIAEYYITITELINRADSEKANTDLICFLRNDLFRNREAAENCSDGNAHTTGERVQRSSAERWYAGPMQQRYPCMDEQTCMYRAIVNFCYTVNIKMKATTAWDKFNAIKDDFVVARTGMMPGSLDMMVTALSKPRPDDFEGMAMYKKYCTATYLDLRNFLDLNCPSILEEYDRVTNKREGPAQSRTENGEGTVPILNLHREPIKPEEYHEYSREPSSTSSNHRPRTHKEPREPREFKTKKYQGHKPRVYKEHQEFRPKIHQEFRSDLSSKVEFPALVN